METSEDLVALLCGKDNAAAYGALQELLQRSAQGSGVYAYMDRFIELMDSPNSLAPVSYTHLDVYKRQTASTA